MSFPASHPAIHEHKGKSCPVTGKTHEFCPPQEGDSRSACPALNTMANHGYIARDGKNLSALDLIKGLKACYGLSNPLAIFLSVVGFLMLKKFRRIDLFEIGKHGVIEHDSSLVHHDTPVGDKFAPIKIDQTLVERLIQDVLPSPSHNMDKEAAEAAESLMNAADVARSRIRREAECRKPDAVHAEIARGEMAIILGVWEKKTQEKTGIPADWIKRWIGEERLPDGWKPDRAQGLWNTVGRSRAIKKAMDKHLEKLKEEASNMTSPTLTPSSTPSYSNEKLPLSKESSESGL